MRLNGTYEALQADWELAHETIELQSGQITELEYEVISLKSDNADLQVRLFNLALGSISPHIYYALQALLVARDDEIYMLKEELEVGTPAPMSRST